MKAVSKAGQEIKIEKVETLSGKIVYQPEFSYFRFATLEEAIRFVETSNYLNVWR